MNWEVFYTDGSSISSDDCEPFGIPYPRREGVQVIIQMDSERVWLTLSGTDYYVWDDRGAGSKWWRVNDRSGLDFYLRQPGFKCVLFGTWIEQKDFNKIFNDAREKWGNRGSFANNERQPE